MPEPSLRILKASSARDLNARVAFNFEDLREQAAAQLVQARQEAERIVDEARREADGLRAKAIADGKALGLKEGMQNAQQLIDQHSKTVVDQRLAEHLKSTLPAVALVADGLQGERDAWLLRWEESALQLSIAIAEKLLHTQLNRQPQLAQGMIRQALQLAVGQTELIVRFHPADLERLGSHAAELVRSLTNCAQPQLVPDAALNPGDCVVETRNGEIDARLDTMLQRIVDELLA